METATSRRFGALHRQRIVHLVRLLETRPPEKFIFADWFSEDWDIDKQVSCDTPACALGLACLDPEFNKQGLTAKVYGDVLTPIHKMPGEQTSGNEIAQSFFGISREDSIYIFFDVGYAVEESNDVHPSWVASKLKRLLRGIAPRYGEIM